MKKIICIALLSILLLTGCSGAMDAPELLEPAKVEADIENASRGEIFKIVMYEATIEPQVSGQSFKAGGVIKKLNVTLGDVVKMGDVLGVLDMTEVQTSRDELASEIEIKTKNHEFDQKELELQSAICRQDGSTFQAELLEVQADEQAKLFDMELAELNDKLTQYDNSLKYDAVTASCGGTVVKMTVNPGDTVRGGSPIIYIADDSTMEISTDYITAADIDQCDRVYASIGGAEYDVEYIPYDRDEYLRLAMTGAEMTSKFAITDPGQDITSGMFTCVYLVTDYVADALKVPANAVHSDSGGSYVYLASNGEQVKQYIEIGVETEAEVQVISGLEEGDAFYVAS